MSIVARLGQHSELVTKAFENVVPFAARARMLG